MKRDAEKDPFKKNKTMLKSPLMISKPPLVSVIIPTYNRKHLIHRAIASVTQQTYQHWELWIVDDGSTDGTFEQLSQTPHPQIHWIKNTQQLGVSASRNKGLQKNKRLFNLLLRL